MIKPMPPSGRGGIAGVAFVFCCAVGGAGLGVDVLIYDGGGVWLFDEPGGRAALGAGAPLVLALAAHALRRLVGRLPRGEGDAGDRT